MSRLVSFLMLLSLMVMVVVVNTTWDPKFECPECYVQTSNGCVFVESSQCRLKREALDDPMAHKTKRGAPHEILQPSILAKRGKREGCSESCRGSRASHCCPY